MVGIVLVSHSHTLARGVVELVRGMAGEDVPLAASGGVDEPDHPLGTDAADVLRAIEEVYSEDGVLVLMDLGSAVLSAETALDMLPGERRDRVLLCEAPLVEGAMAAAVQAGLGSGLDEVAAEARGSLGAKADHLGTPLPARPGGGHPAPEGRSVELDITIPMGLHARPAVRFVETVGRFPARVTVENLTTGKGPAAGRSLNALATMGARQGHRIRVTASGRQAAEVLAALESLAADGFGDEGHLPEPEVARPVPSLGEGLPGLAASPGLAVGEARLLESPEIEPPPGPAGDPEQEWKELEAAIERARRRIVATREATRRLAGEYQAAIFDAHLLFLDDEQLLEPARRSLFEEKSSAAAAWRGAIDLVVDEYRTIEDEYLRARAGDVEAVGRQVLEELVGTARDDRRPAGPGILVARDLTPGETAGLDPGSVQGIATAYGSPTSHSAILARGLGVPAVVGLGEEILEVAEGTLLALDGTAGILHVDPPAELRADYEARARSRLQDLEAARAAAAQPAVTRDGRRVEVAANLGTPAEAREALAQGAEGVGLLRTEFLFLGREEMPDEEEQYRAYRSVAEGMEGRPVILRTLDVGGDKPLPYLPLPPEANPFLGLRAIRLSLERPEVLETQLRAALRVAAEHPVKLMFPMVATLDEYRRAREVAEEVRGKLGAPERIEVGVMVETPALALMVDHFATEVDFFSIGTNDLTQYVFAAERGNAAVASLADPFHPAVLRLVRQVVEAAEAEERWVGVCGEMAADPEAAPLLVGLGVSELSMNPAAIPVVKAAIRRLDLAEARHMAERSLELASAQEVRELLAR